MHYWHPINHVNFSLEIFILPLTQIPSPPHLKCCKDRLLYFLKKSPSNLLWIVGLICGTKAQLWFYDLGVFCESPLPSTTNNILFYQHSCLTEYLPKLIVLPHLSSVHALTLPSYWTKLLIITPNGPWILLLLCFCFYSFLLSQKTFPLFYQLRSH